MNMDKLFKALPRDLQWEVLTEFAGTHVVRYGKLMRKIAYSTTQDGRLTRQVGDKTLPVVNGVRVRQYHFWLYDRHDDIRHFIYFKIDAQMHFCEDAFTGNTVYCYRKVINDLPYWELQFTTDRAEDAITLPPFEKHIYPSYPYTNKKRRIPLIR